MNKASTYGLQSIFGLQGRTALVTGSSRGIGAAIAQGLAAAGAHVFVHGQSHKSSNRTVAAIRSDGGHADPVSAELGKPNSARRLVEQCEDQAGRLDILIINASAQINAPLARVTPEDLDVHFNVNCRSTVEMLQSCLPPMAARRWGRVVSIGSINQYAPKPVVTLYAATKAAQHNLIQSQAREYAGTGVVLNTLAPGLIDTDRNVDRKQQDPEGWKSYTERVNWMGRAGVPSEMVGAALFLASDACSFMTGETVNITGGV
jgi:NAD(P)-dependent dehydrogenase (short-subunit alcohol dehydrogenase family)